MTAVRRLMSRRGEPSRRARRILVVVAVLAIPLVLATLQILDRLDWSPGPHLIAIALILIAFSVPLLALQEFRRNLMRRNDPMSGSASAGTTPIGSATASCNGAWC
jgi:protein-S-isoprenylcysteine O-methyltransferase Ste14